MQRQICLFTCVGSIFVVLCYWDTAHRFIYLVKVLLSIVNLIYHFNLDGYTLNRSGAKCIDY